MKRDLPFCPQNYFLELIATLKYQSLNTRYQPNMIKSNQPI